MENSILYDLLFDRLYNYREKIEKKETYLSEGVKSSYEALVKTLNSEQIELLEDYTFRLSLRNDEIEFEFGVKLSNLAANCGMQLQKSFDEDD